MLFPVRALAFVALLPACGFTHGTVPADAVDAEMPDTPIVPTWAVDGTSKKGVPASASEWSQLIAAYRLTSPSPDHLWLMQEASGSLTDAVGSISLAPLNNPTYAHVVSGWTRLAVGTPDRMADEGFMTSSIGDFDGTSYAFLIYLAVDGPPSSDRALAGIGAASDYRCLAVTSVPTFKATGLGGGASAIGTVDPVGTVHPVLLVVDESHQLYTAYTDTERLAVTWTPTSGTGALVTIGSAAFGSADARYLYAALWAGANAEITGTEAKQLLEALGWSVIGW
jgi:hypothetical protein